MNAENSDNDPPQEDAAPPQTPPPTPVVAIGASAGGLDALKKFFANVPADSGLAYVVVTHTRPQRPSMLPELRRLLRAVLPENTVVTDHRVEHEFPGIGRRVFLLNARRLRQDKSESELILLAFEDVTGSE
jgi:hypothetical protein